jgi:hypothetical protein
MMRTVPLLVIVLFGGSKFASAQGVSAYFGMGTAMDKSNGQQVDPPLGDIGPRMGGLFGKFGADFMLRPPQLDSLKLWPDASASWQEALVGEVFYHGADVAGHL